MRSRRIAFSGLLFGQLLIAGLTHSQNPVENWTATARFSAPEAIQAAAADREHFYAIANSSVAKYDRQTGKRLATSTGEARHLNSAFLGDGRLYASHSNYPLVPEESQIKVLNIQTMQLATWKDFGNFGGSLTWAVLHEDDWWCNFARYGADNRLTFVVQFDGQWNEKSRWTYPLEVIRQLGRYSLSGGLWRDNELLVTGHDDRVLYRLRLPKNGTVLEFVNQQPIPFTGQGIAHDPLTGGLVGIDRGKREVVFAVSKSITR